MDKFILPLNNSEHRCRAKWIQHLGLRSMNNFGKLPSCKDHFSFKICLLDSINLENIKNWALSPVNSKKARKKRSKLRFVPKISPDLIINYIYNLSGGTICAGRMCSQTLWLYTGPSEFDTRTNLQYCSTACLTSHNYLTGDLHIDRIAIITLCLQEKFLLSDSKIYKNPAASGASLFKQLHEATKNLTQSSNRNVLPGKKLQGTSKLVTSLLPKVSWTYTNPHSYYSRKQNELLTTPQRFSTNLTINFRPTTM